MASVKDLQAELESIKATAADERQEFLTAVAGLSEQISALQAIVNDGGTYAERAAILAAMQELNAQVEGISDPEATTSTTTEAPVPEETTTSSTTTEAPVPETTTASPDGPLEPGTEVI